MEWNGYVEKEKKKEEKEKEEENEEKKKDMDHGTSPGLHQTTLKVRTRTWVATAGFGELGCFYKGSR